jgi:hypothetical protein
MSKNKMIEINGKVYPLWNQFVEQKDQWIGGILFEYAFPCNLITTIKDITLVPNGSDSAYFSIIGEAFSCAFDVQYGGITCGDCGWITFSGYGGHTFRIKRRSKFVDTMKNTEGIMDKFRSTFNDIFKETDDKDRSVPPELCTCTDCKDRSICPYVDDPYNTNGDCLAQK